MFKNYSKEALQNLGIYELRNVARQVGVYSPTKYKKEILVDKILAIMQGDEQPYVKKTNQGRPAKQIAGIDEIMNIFVPKIEKKSVYQQQVERYKLFGPSFMQEMNFAPDDFSKCSGFVKLLPENYAVIFKHGYFENNQNSYYLTPQVLNDTNVKMGDVVEGLYYNVDPSKPNIVKRLTAINGMHGEDVKMPKERIDFENLDAIYPNSKIELTNPNYVDFQIINKICPFGQGSRVMINYYENYYTEDLVVDLVRDLSLRYNVTMFSVDDRPEDLSLLKSECVELKMLNKNRELTDDQYFEFFDVCLNSLVRQVESGRNQIVIIKDLQKLEKFFERYFIVYCQKQESEAKFLAQDKIKQTLSLAKNTQEGRALTIIAMNVKNEEYEPLFNSKLIFNKTPYDGTDVYLDCINSITLKANLLLTEDEMNALKQFNKGLNNNNIIEKLNNLL